MSLIHKALKKAEDHFSSPNQQKNNAIPEEGLIGEEKSGFCSSQLTPRTIGLIVLVVLAAAFAIYTNFIADKKPSSPPPVQAEQQAVPGVAEATSTAAPGKAASPANVAGVTATAPSHIVGTKELSPEALAVYEDGQKLFMAGSLDGALVKFEEALTMAPDSAKVLNSLGLALKKKGDRVRAETYYTEAVKKDPGCSECLNNLGVLKADENDNVSAVIYFKKAIAEQETYADPYFNLAVIMEGEGNLKSAVENYKKFLTYTTTTDDGLKDQIRVRIEDLALNWEE